jgi:hypothetical protein
MLQPARGRALTLDGRERFNLFPMERSVSTLYAIGFADGRTKIGKAQFPRKRMRQHWIASEGQIVWAHLFRSFPNEALCCRVERAACGLAAEVSQRIRRTETFIGLSRDDALRCVRDAIKANV